MLKDMGPFRRKSLKRYLSQMSEANPQVLFDDHVAAVLEHQGFQWEEDPRSVYDPQQLYTSLERYATNWDEYEYMDEYLTFGFTQAFKIFAKPKDASYLKVLDTMQTVTSALKLSKSSGLPMMSTKADSLVYSFDREEQVRERLKAPNPCVAYKRTQQGNKTRLVWGYPLEMTIMESRFARPLIDRLLSMRMPMAFGLMKSTLGSYIHRYIVDVPGTVVALDYSKFDSTLSKTMIKQAFRIIGTWFSQEDQDQWGFNNTVAYFIKTPIVMPDGHLYVGKEHGVPSGSYYTQVVDSVINVALMYALSARFDFHFGERALFVLGDDVIVNIKGDVDLEAWAGYLKKFGLQLNLEKTLIGVPHFLGAYWEKGKPDLPIQELVAKAVFPETYRDYGGQPREGAEAVLRSYATTALSAHVFLGFLTSVRKQDIPEPEEEVHPSHLAGVHRFILEERILQGDKVRKAFIPSIAYRLLV